MQVACLAKARKRIVPRASGDTLSRETCAGLLTSELCNNKCVCVCVCVCVFLATELVVICYYRKLRKWGRFTNMEA